MKSVSRIALPAAPENLVAFIVFARGMAESLGMDSGRILDIELALEEALVNIINYAYKGRKPGDIEVSCATGEGMLVIETIDSGTPFDVLSVPPPELTLDLSERRPGGLGVHLIKQLMDEVSYRREGDRNVLTFRVRLGS
jgi:anti-sigma regulatory factor (Ser/Thr protein kinase)